MNERYRQLHNRFSTGMRANIFSSVIFEILQISHQSALIILLTPAQYGLIGVIFSSMYLVITIFELSGVASMGPFLTLFNQSKPAFRYYFLRYIGMQGILLGIGALSMYAASGYTPIFSFVQSPDSPAIAVLMWGVVIEGLRMTLRMFLHGVFWHRSTSSIELGSMAIFLLTVWMPYVMDRTTPSVSAVCNAHIASSLLALILLSIQVVRFYRSLTLDRGLDEDEQANFWHRCFKTRIANYIINVSDKALFTSNLLMPLLANRAGLPIAGLFKFAGYIADAVRGIIRAAIGFSGTALFANLKHSPLAYKQHAFRTVSNNLHKILSFSLVFIGIACYISIGANPQPTALIALATPVALFFTITLIGHLSAVYHTFYIIEEKSYIIVALRCLEIALLYGALLVSSHISPTLTLGCVVIARMASFMILAIDGYYRWKIQPFTGVHPRFVMGSALITFFMLLFFSSISC